MRAEAARRKGCATGVCGSELFKLRVMPGMEGVEAALRVAFSLKISRFLSFFLSASCPGITKVLTLVKIS